MTVELCQKNYVPVSTMTTGQTQQKPVIIDWIPVRSMELNSNQFPDHCSNREVDYVLPWSDKHNLVVKVKIFFSLLFCESKKKIISMIISNKSSRIFRKKSLFYILIFVYMRS